MTVRILSSICGVHHDRDCQSCQNAKQSNDERIGRVEASNDLVGEMERVLEHILGGSLSLPRFAEEEARNLLSRMRDARNGGGDA